MKRLHLIFGMILLMLVSVSCRKNAFDIEIELSQDITTTYRLSYYASNSREGTMFEMGLPLSNGKGMLKCPTYNPTFIYVNGNSNTRQQLIIYAERGNKIKITGKSSDPVSWEVGGNSLNEKWTKWRLENLRELESNDYFRINKAVADFVKKNPKDPLSCVLLLTTYSRRDNEKEFEGLWRSLSDKALDKGYIEALGRADMLNGLPEISTLEKIKLYATPDSIATINFKDYKASLIYFWADRPHGKDNNLDTLKTLRKELKDSTLFVTDISLSRDSVSWIYSVQNDSIDNFPRHWAPVEEMNRQLRAVEIPSTPYFIVLDKKGIQKYRGFDVGAAAKEFRRMTKRKS